jgi:hypothetical protein
LTPAATAASTSAFVTIPLGPEGAAMSSTVNPASSKATRAAGPNLKLAFTFGAAAAGAADPAGAAAAGAAGAAAAPPAE